MREKIEEIEVDITPKTSLLKVSVVVCNLKPVRKLEADYEKLENKLNIAVELLDEWDDDFDPSMCSESCDCVWCKTRRFLSIGGS